MRPLAGTIESYDAPSTKEIARRVGLPVEQIVRFDGNTSPQVLPSKRAEAQASAPSPPPPSETAPEPAPHAADSPAAEQPGLPPESQVNKPDKPANPDSGHGKNHK